jgi:hypothetical protein
MPKTKVIKKEVLEELVIYQKRPLKECLSILGITKCTFYRKMKRYGLRLITMSYYAHNKGKKSPRKNPPMCEICSKVLWKRKNQRCLKHRDIDRNYRAEKNPNWKGGITSENNRLRTCLEYKTWHKSVFRRDKWKCKIANTDCLGRIEAHHILPWRDYPELRFDVDNGITLCRFHHPLRKDEEIKWSPYFQKLVTHSGANASNTVTSYVAAFEALN